jgi:hypothetical protein
MRSWPDASLVLQDCGAQRRAIMDTYLGPDTSFVELHDMTKNRSHRPMREFSDACREEFALIRAEQF